MAALLTAARAAVDGANAPLLSWTASTGSGSDGIESAASLGWLTRGIVSSPGAHQHTHARPAHAARAGVATPEGGSDGALDSSAGMLTGCSPRVNVAAGPLPALIAHAHVDAPGAALSACRDGDRGSSTESAGVSLLRLDAAAPVCVQPRTLAQPDARTRGRSAVEFGGGLDADRASTGQIIPAPALQRAPLAIGLLLLPSTAIHDVEGHTCAHTHTRTCTSSDVVVTAVQEVAAVGASSVAEEAEGAAADGAAGGVLEDAGDDTQPCVCECVSARACECEAVDVSECAHARLLEREGEHVHAVERDEAATPPVALLRTASGSEATPEDVHTHALTHTRTQADGYGQAPPEPCGPRASSLAPDHETSSEPSCVRDVLVPSASEVHRRLWLSSSPLRPAHAGLYTQTQSQARMPASSSPPSSEWLPAGGVSQASCLVDDPATQRKRRADSNIGDSAGNYTSLPLTNEDSMTTRRKLGRRVSGAGDSAADSCVIVAVPSAPVQVAEGGVRAVDAVEHRDGNTHSISVHTDEQSHLAGEVPADRGSPVCTLSLSMSAPLTPVPVRASPVPTAAKKVVRFRSIPTLYAARSNVTTDTPGSPGGVWTSACSVPWIDGPSATASSAAAPGSASVSGSRRAQRRVEVGRAAEKVSTEPATAATSTRAAKGAVPDSAPRASSMVHGASPGSCADSSPVRPGRRRPVSVRGKRQAPASPAVHRPPVTGASSRVLRRAGSWEI